MNNYLTKLLCLMLAMTLFNILTAYSSKDLLNNLKPVISQIWTINPYSGIVDNQEVKLISGATKIGIKTGMRAKFNLSKQRHLLESGLDLQYQPQSLNYYDPVLQINGEREFKFVFIKIPVIYNYCFLKGKSGNNKLALKIGNNIVFTPYKKITNKGSIPDYTIKNSFREMVFGISYYPVNDRMGILLEASRGMNPFYEDPYHKFKEDQTGTCAGLSLGLDLKY